jgi:hypothetical protein
MRTGAALPATGHKQSGCDPNQKVRFHGGNLNQTTKKPTVIYGSSRHCKKPPHPVKNAA